MMNKLYGSATLYNKLHDNFQHKDDLERHGGKL